MYNECMLEAGAGARARARARARMKAHLEAECVVSSVLGSWNGNREIIDDAPVKPVTEGWQNFSIISLNENDRGLPGDLITDSMKSKAVWLQMPYRMFFNL